VRPNWKNVGIAAAALIVLVGVVTIVSSRSGETGGKRPSNSKSPAPPHSGGHPSFVPSGSTNIYAIDVATRALEQLTRNEEEQFASQPVWSARAGIAFTEAPSPEQPTELLLMNPDGSGRRTVPTRVRGLFHPSWAPDGRKLAASRFGSGIHVVDVRTGSVRRLKRTSEVDDGPVWSPDGKTIVFQRRVTGTNWELYRIDPTGRGLRRLTRDPLQQLNPAWSPDGSRLAFAEQQKTGNWAISSMKIDGSDRKLLTDPRLSRQDPSWSPDGKRIALILQEGSGDSIAVIDADGGSPARLTPRSIVAPANPFWSPDSKRIVFAAHKAERPPPGQ
jgi:Tol biopolymer transport system component